MSTETKEITLQDSSSFSATGFDHAQRVAKMLSSSSLVPKEFQNNIQNTLIALEMATRIGASPLMVMQNLYVVHGKPGWSSTFIIAGINSCGRFEPLSFEVNDKETECTAWTTKKGNVLPEKVNTIARAKEAGISIYESPKVTMEMAKLEGWLDKSGSKWKTMPQLMIRYRSAAFFGRLYAPEIMMGMLTADEIKDIEAITVETINPAEVQKSKERERIMILISDAPDLIVLSALEKYIGEDSLLADAYIAKKDQLTSLITD